MTVTNFIKHPQRWHNFAFYWLHSYNFIMSCLIALTPICRIFSNNCFNSNRQITMAIIRIRNQMIATHPTIIFQLKRLSTRHVEKAVQMIIKRRRITWTNTIRNWLENTADVHGVLLDSTMDAVLSGELIKKMEKVSHDSIECLSSNTCKNKSCILISIPWRVKRAL